ncbi:hypothetical protein ACFL4C_04135 [Candidatus Omnitrophota bacterium]
MNNEKLFQDMWDQGENQIDYHEQYNGIVGDHLNSKGNRIMAEFLYNKITGEKLLKSN